MSGIYMGTVRYGTLTITRQERNFHCKTIELENETLETFSNGISRKKRKLDIFELNSELESYFDPR